MKRKFLALLLAACLLVTMLPAALAAEVADCPNGNDCTEHEAAINNKHYDTLEEALTAGKGKTVTLLKDSEITTLKKIGNNKVYTIDLNNHNIGFAAGSYFLINSNGTLNLKGKGKVYEKSPNKAPVVITGVLLSGKTALNVGKDVTLEGWAGVFIDKDGNKNNGIVVKVDGTLHSVRDTDGHCGAGVYINGTLQNMTKDKAPEITLSETSEIISDGSGIYAAGYANWNLAGNVTGNAGEALSIKSGTFNITGGTYTAKGAFADPAKANSNGSETTGAALSITSNDGYAKKTVVNVTGGEFISENGYAVYEGIAKTGEPPAAAASYATLNISGGTFTGDEEKGAVNISTAENKRVITSGTFSSDVIKYVADGYATSQESDDYIVEPISSENAAAEIISGETTTYYATLAEAIDAANAGDTVTILKDIDGTGYNILDVTGLTLDLNAHKISADNFTLIFQGSDFTIRNGSLDSNGGSYALFIGDEQETENIVVENVTLSGGMNIYNAHNVVVRNVDITGVDYYAVWCDQNAQTVIESGTFKTNGNAVLGMSSAVYDTSLEIKGGCFIERGKPLVLEGTDDEGNPWNSPKITGGYFTSNPTNYLAEGYYAIASNKPDYAYMVSDKEPEEAQVVVTEKANTEVKIEDVATAEQVSKVIGNAGVTGIADAVSDSGRSAIVAKADVVTGNLEKTDIVELEIEVKIEAVAATLDANSNFSSLTYSAIPTATVKENGDVKQTGIEVPNNYLNNKPFAIKLPLPDGFKPVEIIHIADDRSRERFLEDGTMTFEIIDDCVVLEITHFSQLVMNGTFTVAAKIDETEYGTVQEAIDAATSGATIVLQSGVSADEKVKISGKSVTIQLNNQSFSKENIVTDSNSTVTTDKDGNIVITYTAPVIPVTPSKPAETACPQDSTCPAMAFSDVVSGQWYHDGIHFCVKNGLMNGVGDGLFDPNGNLSRAMLVTVLYRLEGSPVAGSATFSDVADGLWYSDAVAWAAENEIVNGIGHGKFAPEQDITREQMAAILYRYATYKGYDTSAGEDTNILSYTDALEISEYAVPAMQWTAGEGLITGRTASTLAPQGTATRAEVATILMRFCENIVK